MAASSSRAKPTVFIHTNDQQLLGAKVSAYSLHRASPNHEKFDVKIIELNDYPHLTKRDGQSFIRDGKTVVYQLRELQSFTPLRFLPPQLMNFQGRAVVIDPDIFAVADVYELLSRDMEGKAVMCRLAKNGKTYASSCMLMDCEKLSHWKWDEQIDQLFAQKFDYQRWIHLELEPEGSVGVFEDEWNDFDTLDEGTKLLHNTRRRTQPWKTGLPYQDLHRIPQNGGGIGHKLKSLLGGNREDRHESHPDQKQQQLFFTLVAEMLDSGKLSREELQAEIDREYLRTDAFDIIEKMPREAAKAG